MGLPTRLERPSTSAFLPSSAPSVRFSRIRQPSGVHGTMPLSPAARRPALTTWRPSTSLSGFDRVDDRAGIDVVGQRQLDEDAVNRDVGIADGQGFEQRLLRRFGRQLDVGGGHTRLFRRFALVAYVDGAGGIVADQDNGQSGGDAVRVPEAGDAPGQIVTQLGRHRLAVDDGRRSGRLNHVDPRSKGPPPAFEGLYEITFGVSNGDDPGAARLAMHDRESVRRHHASRFGPGA